MRSLICTSLLCFLLFIGSIVKGADGLSSMSRALKALKEEEDGVKRFHWAVLLAGSRSFWNYRHQADVCHAYQILKAQGIPDDHIITMVYDDIAYSYEQEEEYMGQIYNRPGGPNVYEGCAKDYTGYNVNKETFYAVLTGNKTHVEGIESERVVESGPEDNIFVFYSDHGSFGLIGMPSGGPIFADKLNKVLQEMHANKQFKEMVIYIESCESGSMFENILPDDIGVYALTASNATESSWATYCPVYYPEDIDPTVTPNPDDIGACLGDLFATSWMEDTENHDTGSETLHQQYEAVFDETAATELNDFLGSEVKQYGAVEIDAEITGDFLSTYFNGTMQRNLKNKGHEFLAKFTHLHESDPLVRNAHRLPWGRQRVRQRDADLVFFMHKALVATNLQDANARLSELRKMVVDREQSDIAIRRAMGALVNRYQLHHHLPILNAAVEENAFDVEGRRAAKKPAVDDWSCFREMIEEWETHCGTLNTYSLKYTRTFATICNIGLSPKDLAHAASVACSAEVDEKREQISTSLVDETTYVY